MFLLTRYANIKQAIINSPVDISASTRNTMNAASTAFINLKAYCSNPFKTLFSFIGGKGHELRKAARKSVDILELAHARDLENDRIAKLDKATSSTTTVLSVFGQLSPEQKLSQERNHRSEVREEIRAKNEERKRILAESKKPYNMMDHVNKIMDEDDENKDKNVNNNAAATIAEVNIPCPSTKAANAAKKQFEDLLNAKPEDTMQQHKIALKL